MKAEELFDILRPLKVNSKVSKEEDAIKLFGEIEEEVVLKFKGIECFKYLAIVKKEEDEFCLELAYDPHKVAHKNEISKMISFIREELNGKLEILVTHGIHGVEEFKGVFDKIPINTTEMSLEFKLHNNNNPSKKKCISDENIIGEQINLQSENAGALGGILKLHNYSDELFLITNYHVIFKSDTKMNDPLYLNGEHLIAHTFWGMFNSKADIAIAKLENKNYHKGTPYYCFGSLNQPKINDVVQKYGPYGHDNTGHVYSSKAILKINDYIFINQLLIMNLDLKGGESGTLITQGCGKIKNVIGLHFGGTNGELDFANNLHQIFSDKIPAYYEKKYKRNHPEIHFKSFY